MLTPIDIQNHVLKSTMGGYNKKETDDFIESVQASYEQLYKENHDLKEKVTALSEGLQYYKQMEGTLQKTLMLAEKTATETLEASRTKASKVEKESQQKANVMLSSAKAKADAIVSESEAKVNALLTESQTKADSLLSDAKNKAENLVSEAQQKANNLLANANERVDRVLAEAKKTAGDLVDQTRFSTEHMMDDANHQLSEVSSTARTLIDCYSEYKEQFKAMLHKQLAQLEDPGFMIQVPDLQKTLEKQQVSIAEQQTSLADRLDRMEGKTKELELPVDETAPAKQETEPVTEILAEDIIADAAKDIAVIQKELDDATETVTATEENPFLPEEDAPAGETGGEEAASFDKEANVLEALAKMVDSTVSEEPEAAAGSSAGHYDNNSNSNGSIGDFADIALEALRRANSEVIPKAPMASDETSVLGTSYDDFDPQSQAQTEYDTDGQQHDAPEFTSAQETEQKVIPMPDFAGAAVEAPSFMPEQGQPAVPMPDFASAAETPSFEPEQEQPVVPMPDFASAAAETPGALEEAAIQAENYITKETYFGSADNIPYTGAVADFSNGISGGETETAADGADTASELFSGDFSGAATAPADEFAVSGNPSDGGQETPFTFIDANDAN